MTFRDDRDALYARAEALEQDLEQAEKELAEAEGDRERLTRERDAMRKELEKLRGSRNDDDAPAQTPDEEPGRTSWLPWVGAIAPLAVSVIVGVAWYYKYEVKGSQRPAVSASAGRPVAMCPLRGDGTLIVVDQAISANRHKYFYSYNVYEAATGDRQLRVAIAGVESHTPACSGYEDDLVWLLRSEESGYLALRASTGQLVRRQADIAAEAGVSIHEVYFDNNGHHLLVTAMDGRRYHVIAADGFRLAELPKSHRAEQTTVYWPHNPDTWAQLDDSRRMRPEGNARRRFLIGEQPIGDRDWLLPDLVNNPATGTPLWTEPDSLIIVEPTLIKSEIFKATRYSLDGNEIWSFDPQLPSHTTNWANYIPVGDTLVYPTKDAQLIGIDPATGQQRYRVKM